MRSLVRQLCASCLLPILLAFAAVQPSRAQSNFDLGNIGVSKGQAVGIIVGVVAIAAVVGVGIYFIARTPRVTGCLVASNGGLDLQGGSPDELFRLAGQTGGLVAGQRVKVLGKKSKAGSGPRSFTVNSVAKNYGPCVPPAKTASLSPAAIGGPPLGAKPDKPTQQAAQEAMPSSPAAVPLVSAVSDPHSVAPLP